MPKMINLLLTDNVDNLGIVGDVVDVKPGYARNFLLPRGLAMPPTKAAIKRLAARRAEVEKEMARKRAAQQKMIEQLEAFELTMQRSANEQGILYGGVSQHDIAEALREQGFEIEDRHVRIGEQIKRLDSYPIPVVLAQDLRTEIKLWVVSDRPLETQEQAEAEEAGETVAEAEGEGEAKAETEAEA
jgi:large subunit ribosomal protein L9